MMTIHRHLFISVFWVLCLMANGQQSVPQQTEEILLYDKIHEIVKLINRSGSTHPNVKIK